MKTQAQKFTVVVSLLFLINATAFSQGVNIGSNTPADSSATLEVSDTSGGFLLPRLTTAQRNAINNPAVGLQIYNLTTNCIQVYMPQSGWRDVVCDCQTPPSSAFTFSDTASLNQNVIFSATTPGMTYSWAFQSGTPSTSSQQTDTVTWSSTGTYTISLTVTNNYGCYTTTTDSIYIDSCSMVVGNNTVAFNYTGAVQTWTVPQGVCTIKIECWGASGGGNNTGGLGQSGRGGYTSGKLIVSPGDVFYIYVGQQGGMSQGNSGPSYSAYNGGGYGDSHGYPSSSFAAGGGGASDIRFGGQTLSSRIMVAGGGGGGHVNYDNKRRGGPGGGLTAGNGGSNNGITAGGTGGTQTAGGVGGQYGGQAGSLGQGGNGVGTPQGGGPCCAGGGGGGYYGGGGGNHSGAGGGSSYISGHTGCQPLYHSSGKFFTNTIMQQGIRHGNGKIVITY